MQNPDELCSTCGKRWGAHFGDDCPDPAAPTGFSATKTFKSSNTFSSGDVYDERCQLCTSRYVEHKGDGLNCPNYSAGLYHPTQVFMGSKIYAAHGVKVAFGNKTVAIHSGGMKCCRCQNFNDYAEPNMPDGSYKCFSCRR